MTRTIEIVEVGPRDGLQHEAASLPTPAKLEFIRRAVDAGVRRIEVASFVNPRRVPQMADAEAIFAGLEPRDDVTYVGLVLNRTGFDRAAAAGCREISMVVFTTDEFNRRNQGVTSAESIRQWQDQARLVCRVPELRGHDAQVLVACGLRDPESIAQLSPQALFAIVGPFVATKDGQRLLRSAKSPDLAEVTDWITWAQQARALKAA